MPASDVPGEHACADAADPGQAAAVLPPSFSMRPTSPTSARPTAHRFSPSCEKSAAGRPSTRPAGREQSSSPASTVERTGPGHPSTRRPACSTSTRTMSRTSSRSSNPRQATDRRYGPYVIKGYDQFLDHEGYPAIKPPWGVLSAIDLNTGEFAWQVPLGRTRRTDSPRHSANRHRNVRRLDRDRRRPGFHRRHQGRAHPRL